MMVLLTSVTDATNDEAYVYYEGEDECDDDNMLDDEEVEQSPPDRPWHYNRNAYPTPRQVRDDDHVAKLKLNITLRVDTILMLILVGSWK
jgi:hypothetical protein